MSKKQKQSLKTHQNNGFGSPGVSKIDSSHRFSSPYMVSHHILNEYMWFHSQNMSQNDIKITPNDHVGTWWSLGDQDGSLLVPGAPGRLRGELPKVGMPANPGFYQAPTGLQPGPTGPNRAQPGSNRAQPGFPGEFLALKPTTYGSKQKETLTRSTPRGVGGPTFSRRDRICNTKRYLYKHKSLNQ